LYHNEKVDGKYSISLDEALLEKPESLIATIAHELSHVKLLGEKKLEQNDEMLTDFTTVFFGLGIFNANCAFQFYKQNDRWGYSNLGYLKIEEWAYALALFALALFAFALFAFALLVLLFALFVLLRFAFALFLRVFIFTLLMCIYKKHAPTGMLLDCIFAAHTSCLVQRNDIGVGFK
jgi:hypothetical protein